MTALPTRDEIYNSEAAYDPRELGIEALAALGHEKISPTKAIRAKCLDCCGNSSVEVGRCQIVDCSLWPFRMGVSPFRPKLNDEQKQHRAEAFRQNVLA